MSNRGNNSQIDQELEELWNDGLTPKEWQALKSELIQIKTVQPSAQLRLQLKGLESPSNNKDKYAFHWAKMANLGLAAVLLFMIVRQYNYNAPVNSVQEVYIGEELNELVDQFAFVMNFEDEPLEEDLLGSDLVEIERLVWDQSDVA